MQKFDAASFRCYMMCRSQNATYSRAWVVILLHETDPTRLSNCVLRCCSIFTLPSTSEFLDNQVVFIWNLLVCQDNCKKGIESCEILLGALSILCTNPCLNCSLDIAVQVHSIMIITQTLHWHFSPIQAQAQVLNQTKNERLAEWTLQTKIESHRGGHSANTRSEG